MSNVRPPRVLVVEDDWFLAREIADAVRSADLAIAGPTSCPIEAERIFATSGADAALLDINVGDTTTFDLAKKLVSADVPTIFHSNWSADSLPSDLAFVPLVPKWQGAAKAVATLRSHLNT